MAQENGCLVECNMSHSGCYQEMSFWSSTLAQENGCLVECYLTYSGCCPEM